MAAGTLPGPGSDQLAAEMVERYWLALTRDVPFDSYAAHPLTRAAARDLSRCAAFPGPRIGRTVTPGTLFRGPTPGDLTGPYLSQFLWVHVPHGTTRFTERGRVPVPGNDPIPTHPGSLAVRRGALAPRIHVIDPMRRPIRNGRDLTEYVHLHQGPQAFLDACAILLVVGAPFTLDSAYVRRPSRAHGGLTTFGGAHVLDCIVRVADAARTGTCWQKRTHPAVLSSAAMAGACTTALKACFDETFVIPDPVVASSDGTSLVPWTGALLSVGGELNKLASNVALGRDIAAVHSRSDRIQGLELGEAVATGILLELRRTSPEVFSSFSFTRFDGGTMRG